MIHIDLMYWRHVSITTTPCWGSRLVALLHARAVLEERWLSVGARARAGPAVWHCRGWPAGCMLGDGACDSASFDPQHAGAPFCDVICIRSIRNQYWTIPLRIQSTKSNLSAVYTGIRKPESFSHSGFSLKVARQLPLNTPKNPNRKTHLRSVIFWNSAEISLVFCQCKRSLQSRRYYSGFWSRGTWPSAESPDRGPRRNAHYTCTVKGREKSRMRTTYQNTSMRFGVFSRMRFSCQKPWMLWVFLAV